MSIRSEPGGLDRRRMGKPASRVGIKENTAFVRCIGEDIEFPWFEIHAGEPYIVVRRLSLRSCRNPRPFG